MGGRYELYKPDYSKTIKGGSIVTKAPETRANHSYTPHITKEYSKSVKPNTI